MSILIFVIGLALFIFFAWDDCLEECGWIAGVFVIASVLMFGYNIIQYPYKMSQQRVDTLREQILKQKESGIILLSDLCKVVTKPKDTEIQVELEKEDEPTPWLLVDNESHLFCDECGIIIENNYFGYRYCPYCGKKHTFGKEE